MATSTGYTTDDYYGEEYWVTNPNGYKWYDYASAQAAKSAAEAAETAADTAYTQAQTGQTEAETAQTEAETALIGVPTQSTTSTAYSGDEPTMGDLAEFNLPEYGDVPDYESPEMEETPEFEAPEWDEAAINKATQQNAASGIRSLKSAVQQAMASASGSDNPNVQKMLLRDALAGYGEGLEEVMSGARTTATEEYATKYAYEYETAGMTWEAAVQAVRDKYAGDLAGSQLEYQAELDAVNAVYSASVAAEQSRVDAENAKVLAMYESALSLYLASGVTTTVEEYLT